MKKLTILLSILTFIFVGCQRVDNQQSLTEEETTKEDEVTIHILLLTMSGMKQNINLARN